MKWLRSFALPAALATGLLLAAGCGKIPTTHYYALDAGLPAVPASSSLPFDVAVARFHTPQLLAQDRLVYRTSPHQVDYYNYHRWSGAPADLVTDLFLSRLRNAGLFRSVSTLQGGPKADYLLRGTIDNLEEVNSAEGVSARVALTLEAQDMKTREVVWTGKGSYEKPVSDRTVEGVVRELNEGVHQSLEQITRGLAAHFQSQKPLSR